MKNLIFILIISILLTNCANSQNNKLTSEQIWEKYLESFGNKEELLKIKTLSSSSVVDTKNGKIYSKRKIKYPDKVYHEILYPNNMTLTYIVNGDSGIVKSPNGVEYLPLSEVKLYKQSALIFSEIYYKELGYKIELIGEEKSNDKRYYNLKVTTEFETLNYLIGQDYFEIYKLISGESTTEVVTSIKIDGINVIKKSKYFREGKEWVANLIEQEFNIEINDSIFNLK